MAEADEGRADRWAGETDEGRRGPETEAGVSLRFMHEQHLGSGDVETAPSIYGRVIMMSGSWLSDSRTPVSLVLQLDTQGGRERGEWLQAG